MGKTQMQQHATQNSWIVFRLFKLLRKHGPLGTFRAASISMQSRLAGQPVFKKTFLLIDRCLWAVYSFLDGRYDAKCGTDTSGVIPLKELTIRSDNVGEGVWYEPMSAKVFKQIMNHLTIDFGGFEFIDFGSGKGRVLLLAADYGFRRIIGVEFAQELHGVATENIAIYEQYTRRSNNIETFCMDAAHFSIPDVPLVAFFYSPFKGKVMEQVLNNVSASFASNPREIILIFYGDNSATLELLQKTKFECRELDIRADWSRFLQYRGFLFSSPKTK